jgi:hypothetical protein
MTRDETKRAAEEALRGDARAYLDQCEREEKVKALAAEIRDAIKALPASDGRVIGLAAFIPRLDAAIKAIEEG